MGKTQKNIKEIRFTETFTDFTIADLFYSWTSINVDTTLTIKFYFSYLHFSMSLKIPNKHFS